MGISYISIEIAFFSFFLSSVVIYFVLLTQSYIHFTKDTACINTKDRKKQKTYRSRTHFLFASISIKENSKKVIMYPNLGPGSTQPSIKSMPPSTSTSVLMSNPNMNTKPLGFSSLMSNPSAQNATYPGGQSSQVPYPSAPPASSYTAPYPTNAQPSNASSFSSYSLPNVGRTTSTNQGQLQ